MSMIASQMKGFPFAVSRINKKFVNVSLNFTIPLFLLMPIMYAIMGFLMTALWCWIYNMVAKRIGGIEIEVEVMDE